MQLIVLFLAVLTFVRSVDACSCVGARSGNPPCQSFWNSPVVFSGRVAEITPVEVKVGELASFRQFRVRFAVSADHRGGVGQIVDVTTGQGGGDCGYKFEINEHYLVYAYKGENGTLSTGICSPTKRLVEASDDLEYIQGLTRAKPVGSLFGGVWEYKPRRSTDEWRPQPPMSGIPLTLAGKAGRYATVTDSEGRYRIPDILPGEYLLNLTAPEGYAAPAEAKVTIREKGCSVMDFTLARETSVSGRILDAGGEPVTQLLVDLVPIEEIEQQYQKDRQTAQLDDNGRFSFRGIPPGRYYLGIGLGRWSVVKHAFPKTYYPGTQNRSAAAVVVVAEGQIQKDIDFQMPLELPERKVTGIVVFPDGKAAAKAHVTVVEGEYNAVSGAVSGEDGRFELSLLEGLTYRVRAYINLPSGEQRHADFVSVPPKAKVTNLKIVISEPAGSCAKCRFE
ncbi:MAG: carboxypeptidase regulatory-like domain-containing protein [Pyrinomonadaceae bacterium]